QVTISRAADVVRLDWRAEPNTVYRLQSSPGLTAWDTTQTVTSDASGAATATVAPDATARFFRVIKE
ncbi:MAG: hypothetical protein JNL97_13080, partial [Verrucomicrobiales bacterium]|nr:hypothetical protein [Verrucomicrobiales bacterium]